MEDAYIIAGYRSAVGKAGRGGFRNYRSDDLAVDIIKHLMAQVPELDPALVDDVIVGSRRRTRLTDWSSNFTQSFGQRSAWFCDKSLLCFGFGGYFDSCG
jgi:acetyl-CoA acetyltransferase